MGDNIERDSRVSIVKVVCICVVLAWLLGILIFTGKCAATYNNLIDAKENVKLAKSNVETMMQRRLELIPDLVETVKMYTEHEEKIFDDIAQASLVLSNSWINGDPKEISEADKNVSTEINGIISVAKNYPELTSSKHYTALMDELAGSVNRIATARDRYNQQVAIYNKKVNKFPGNIMASIFGFEEMDEFEADKEAERTNMLVD